MSTSQKLQTPSIIEIIGSTIRVAHPDISGNTATSLGNTIAAAGTAMTVLDNMGLADNDWLVIGAIGDPKTETTDINGAVTEGTSLTVTNLLKFAHEIDAPVTKILERGIKIYGAATDGGAGTLIESIDAITASGRQLADATMIKWDKPYTEYTMISTDTAYAYYYVEFTDGTTESSASDYVAAGGLGSNSVEYFIRQACEMTNTNLDDEKITRDQCVKWAQDAQLAVTQFMYKDPRSGLLIQKDWDFEITTDSSTLLVTNKNKYDLSDLNMKYPYNKGVIEIQVGTKRPLLKIQDDDYAYMMQNKPYTEVATQAEIGDTSLVVDSLVEFSDPDGSTATLYVNGQTITYTGVTGTTTFTGIPASGTGSITAQIAVDAGIWQNNAPATPRYYLISQNTLYLVQPPESSYNNYPVNIKYFKNLTPLTQPSDTTAITFTNCFQYYIGSMICRRKGNDERADKLMGQFNNIVLNNAIHQKVPSTKFTEYYNYTDPLNNFGRNLTYDDNFNKYL